MKWWQNMVVPKRRVWVAVGAPVKPPDNGGGLLKLHDDIQTCGYQDIQVMWEILNKTESGSTLPPSKRKPRPFWKILVCHNTTKCSATFSIDHVKATER